MGRSLSPAHKAAIAAGLKRYWASKKGGSIGSASPARKIINVSTGSAISREEAARIMFGSAGAAKKLAAGKKRRR